MTEQHLDDADIDAIFEQVRGEAVAQGVRSDTLVDIRGLGCLDDDPIELARADRRRSALAREEPAIGNEDALLPSGTPPVAQQQEQAFGQHRVAVAAAFTALDPQQHALAVDIGHLQRRHLGDTQSGIIVAATGFNLSVMGGIPFEVDGAPVDWSKTVTYRGMMMTGVPNLAWVMGYFRASWTLRVDMMGDFVCNLLNHMDDIGANKVEVALRPEDADMQILPWIEEDNFNPGYLMRGLEAMPRRGDKPEWRHNQDYWAEKDAFPKIDLRGAEFVYDGKRTAPEALETAAAG